MSPVSAGHLAAVIPVALRRRWDAIALEQLCQRLAALGTENESLRSQLAAADESADFWRENAMELAGQDAGITVDGRLVRP